MPTKITRTTPSETTTWAARISGFHGRRDRGASVSSGGPIVARGRLHAGGHSSFVQVPLDEGIRLRGLDLTPRVIECGFALAEEGGRSFDVGEQQGEGARREVAHRR